MKKLTAILIVFLGFIVLTNAQNNCLDFDGTDDYITCGDFELSDASFSIEGWFKADDFPGSGAYYHLFGFESGMDAALCRLNSSKQLEFIMGHSTGTKSLASSTVLQLGVWYHAEIHYDWSTGYMRILLNGKENAVSNPVSGGSFNYSNQTFTIGGNSSSRYFNGQIDEVRVWEYSQAANPRTQATIRAGMYTSVDASSSGLYAYYKLDETSGAAADNAEGTGSFDGTLSNMEDADWVTSSAFYGPKYCLDFDGSDDGVYCSNIISGQSSLTIEAWIYVDNIGSVQRFAVQRDGNGFNGAFVFEINTDGTLDFWDYDGGFGFNDNTTTSGAQISTGKWHHVAVAKNSSTATYYIDGIAKATEAITGSDVSYSASIAFAIGYDARENLNYLDGKIDELRVWTNVLTDSQIRENMCNSLTGNETNLVAYYNFDNSTGTSLQDMTSSLDDGTLSNFTGTYWVASSAFNTWLNTSSTTWATAANWSNGVPGSTDNVGIYNLTSEPDISGSPTFNSLYLGSSTSTALSSGMTVNASLIMDKDLDLNGQTITLGPEATLVENSGTLSGSTGTITTTRNLSNISAENVGGLGATITTTADMGSTTITRGHSTTGINGLNRYFQISPTTNTSLDATLVFSYDDTEINTQTEANLKLYKSSDGSSWTQQASSTVNTGNNTLSLSSIDSFSHWTGGEDRTPTVTTQAVTSITKYTATGNGNITELGITDPTEHGVCWSTSSGPTVSDSKTTNGAVSATGAFTSSITGLVSNTTYYVKAYATNATGTAYGSEVNFTTPVSGADNYSVQSGNWNTASTWSTGVPSNNSTVDVLSGHTVTLDVDMASSGVSLNVEEGGTLTSNGAEYGILIKTNGYFTVYGTIYVYSIDVKNNVDPKYIYSTGDVTVWNFFDHSGGQTVPITVDGKLTILSPGELRNDGDIIGTGTITAANYVGSGTIFDVSPTSSISGSIAGFTWNGSSSTEWNNTSNWISGAVPSSSSHDAVIQDGLTNYPTISTTGNICRNLLLESGAEITIAASSDITVSGILTIKSDASGTGSIVNNGTLTASAECERYIDDWNTGDGWHFLSSPVASQAIQPNFVPTTPTSNEDFYAWDEVNDEWVNSESSSGVWNSSFDDTFVVGKGYLVAYSTDQTKTFTGTINNADVPKSGLTYTEGSTHYGANFLGNPYPCALQWNQTSGASGWNLSNIDGTAKIWSSTNSSYEDISSGGIIPSMQGFMVLVSSTGTGSLNIYKDDRTHSTTSWYKNNEGTNIKLVVHDIAGGTAQESVLMAREDATDEFDHEHDSPFFEGYAPKFHSMIGQTPASSNAISEFTEETIIPFTFKSITTSDFYIELSEAIGLDDQLEVNVYDNKTGISHNLSNVSKYYFSSEKGVESERFVITFNDISSIDQLSKEKAIRIYSTGSKVILLSPTSQNGHISIYNMFGQLVYETDMQNEAAKEIDLRATRGYYVVIFGNSNVQRVEKVWID